VVILSERAKQLVLVSKFGASVAEVAGVGAAEEQELQLVWALILQY
jgi:hypothetical protein